MTGETYIYANIRVKEHDKATLALLKAKELERLREEKVRQGLLKKRITYDRNSKLTTIHYYV